MNDFVIEDGVPIPNPRNRLLELACRMNPGQSVVFDDIADAVIMASALDGIGLGSHFAKTDDGKWRVWRVS